MLSRRFCINPAVRQSRFSMRHRLGWSHFANTQFQQNRLLPIQPALAGLALSLLSQRVAWSACGRAGRGNRGSYKQLTRLLERRPAHSSSAEASAAIARLAQLFPGAVPIRVPVHVASVRTNGNELEESTVIEYRTPAEILFISALPIEFEDRLRVKSSDGSLEAEARVVAVQYIDGCKTVAARLSSEVTNWIPKA